MFFVFVFAVLKIHVAIKHLEQTTYAYKLQKKQKQQNSASVQVSLQDKLIIAMQRFALNSADAIERNYPEKRLEIRLQTPNNRSLV